MFQKKSLDVFLRNISRRVAEIRAQKGLTQLQLSEKMGVDLRLLQRWECNKNFNFCTLYKFMGVLECNVADFFLEPKTPPNGRGRPRKNNCQKAGTNKPSG